MEIKLFVRTHKENFGSVLLFSNNMLPKEKRVMEDIKYTNYDPDETEIIEISVPGFFIYFCTYIGGQDEFGRDYQNVIGTIFPFRITESDVLSLRKTFGEIMKDISSRNFTEQNRYFAEIKAKANIKYHSKNGKSFLGISFKKFLLFIVLASILAFTGFKFKNQILDYFSINNNIKKNQPFDKASINKYNFLMKSIYKESDSSVKYRLYKELLSEIEVSGETIKKTEADSKFNEIKNEYAKNSNDNTALVILIQEYLKNSDFKENFKKVKSIQKKIEKGNELSILKSIEDKITAYNNNMTGENLTTLISSCKDISPMLSNKERKYTESIISKANLIYKGIGSEIEVYISDKSAVYNRRTLGFEVQVDKQDSQYKNKPMNNDPDIYAGSFFVKLSPFSKVKFKIYDHSYSGKKILLKEIESDFSELNKPFVVSDGNDNSFKVELRIISDKFKIKSN